MERVETKGFTCSQVSAHNAREDCWVIINGKVYDVTNYLNEHPGGDEVLLEQAGKDGSQEFEDVGHGSAARLMLDEFYVGEIVDPSVKSTEDAMMSAPGNDMEEKLVESNNKISYFLVVLAVVGSGVGIHHLFLTSQI